MKLVHPYGMMLIPSGAPKSWLICGESFWAANKNDFKSAHTLSNYNHTLSNYNLYNYNKYHI